MTSGTKKRLDCHLRYGDRLLIQSAEFPPSARHATRLSIAGRQTWRGKQTMGEVRLHPRFPAAPSGLVKRASLSEVGDIRTNPRTAVDGSSCRFSLG